MWNWNLNCQIAEAIKKKYPNVIFNLAGMPYEGSRAVSIESIRGYGFLGGIDIQMREKPGKAGFQVYKECYKAGLNIKPTGDALIIAPPFICEKKQLSMSYRSMIRNIILLILLISSIIITTAFITVTTMITLVITSVTIVSSIIIITSITIITIYDIINVITIATIIYSHTTI